MCPNSVPVLVTTSALCPTPASCRPPFDVSSHAVMPITPYSMIVKPVLLRTKGIKCNLNEDVKCYAMSQLFTTTSSWHKTCLLHAKTQISHT